jgi:carboxylesterase type B
MQNSDLKYPIVETEYGPVKGLQTCSDLGRNFFKFSAVPFMKAPLGKLRFRDAQPPEKWSEPLDVTGDRPSFTSIDFINDGIVGQEDAGIVSVDTPYLDRNLPVAVYIHGGGFQGV